MGEQFVSERIQPVKDAISTVGMAVGEPGFPEKFLWRRKEYAVAGVLEKWKDTSRCKSGGNEQYVRRHWYRIQTTDGSEMKIYFERQARSKNQRLQRWWLYTVCKNDTE